MKNQLTLTTLQSCITRALSGISTSSEIWVSLENLGYDWNIEPDFFMDLVVDQVN